MFRTYKKDEESSGTDDAAATLLADRGAVLSDDERKKRVVKLLLLVLFLALGCAVAWQVSIHSFEHSTKFSDEDFNTGVCKDGKAQSPIDIITAETIPISPTNIITISGYRNTQSEIVDTGHSIQVNIVDHGGSVNVQGIEYMLVQFHFHARSEEKIDGKQYDLVAHMVHKSNAGGILVIAVLFEETRSGQSGTLDTVIHGVGSTAELNPGELLPPNSNSYFHYLGSLTTPPCTEGVLWYIMKDIQGASTDQIAAMRQFHPRNYRPIQPLNGRAVESK